MGKEPGARCSCISDVQYVVADVCTCNCSCVSTGRCAVKREFVLDPTKPTEKQVFDFLNNTSHHVIVTDENRHLWLLSEKYRDKPWRILTPRGTFQATRLSDYWSVPRSQEPADLSKEAGEFWWAPEPIDVFVLSRIIWHSDEDGWVAQYDWPKP